MAQDLSGQTIGECRLLERIDSGGMATVYRAQQYTPHRPVAVKIIRPELANDPNIVLRFRREADTIAALEHPNILPIFASGYDEKRNLVYLVTRLMTGGSLDDLIQKGPLPLQRVIEIMRQLGSALHYAHQNGVIHRDLKPGNVLLDEPGNVYLTDFGIAKLLHGTMLTTQPGMVIGTPPYMAPEQWTGRPVDRRTDVYALGVMLYQMLTKRLPFEATTHHQLMYQHLEEPPPPLSRYRPDLPQGVADVIRIALSKRPADRFATVMEMVATFEAAARGEAVAVLRPITDRVQTAIESYAPAPPTPPDEDLPPTVTPPPPPIPTSGGRRRALIGGILAILVVVIGLIVWQWPEITKVIWASTPTATATATGTFTPTTSPTPGPSETPTLTPTPSPTASHTPTETPSPTETPTLTPTPSPTPSSTHTNTPTATYTSTETPTDTPTPTFTPTDTPVPTVTPVPPVTGNGDWTPVIQEFNDIEMMLVPPGCFDMGAIGEGGRQCFDEPFWIGRYEVTNAQYNECVDAGVCEASGRADDADFNDPRQPVVSVSWFDARAYVVWLAEMTGAEWRLPTEAEWEYAARGPDGWMYPWGRGFDSSWLNFCDVNCREVWGDMDADDGYRYTAPVGSFSPAGDSWVGAADMAGNVWEWTNTIYDNYPYDPADEDPDDVFSDRVTRGGSWYSSQGNVRAIARLANRPSYHYTHLGFRVVALRPPSP